jgi:xanthine/CO dehydrogenase XdhC/CoxF family maturation factor
MGTVLNAKASSAREAGAKILTDAEAEIRGGTVKGVHLLDGRSFEGR